MIDRLAVLAMINHWLNHDPNAFFGSSYGAPITSLFMKALTAPIANAFIEKMKLDLPVLSMFSSDAISIYQENKGFEQKKIIMVVGDLPPIDLSAYRTQSTIGDTFDVNAG